MPVLEKSDYRRRPFYLSNRHLETIIPSIFYSTKGVVYSRERINTPDGDFLDLDWIKSNNKRVMVLSHGLEGSSDRQYITRPAKYFNKRGWDVLAWNCRGCSGEVNKALRTYQHGDIVDIGSVITKVLDEDYEEVVLMGYSMGGNMTLKYLGTNGDNLDKRIKGAVVYSVPCNLEDSSKAINLPKNRFYEKRFLRKLKEKIELKVQDHPSLNVDWSEIKDFSDFNKAFTLPVFGFQSEEEFFEQARTDSLLGHISVPTLIVNALNDPMLEGRNYPIEAAKRSENVTLEIPEFGGHVGFTMKWNDVSYMETRAEEFFNSLS